MFMNYDQKHILAIRNLILKGLGFVIRLVLYPSSGEKLNNSMQRTLKETQSNDT